MTAVAERPAASGPVGGPTQWAGGDPSVAVAELQWVLERAITGAARSVQTAIGPSELGIDCVRCLAYKLAGRPQARDAAWLPTIGTAVHAWAQNAVDAHNHAMFRRHGCDARFLTEQRVVVGAYDGTQVAGTCDLFDVVTGTVVDYKVVGDTTLRKVRSTGPSAQYVTQAHLYGRGWERLGFTVSHVGIWYLPRNGTSLGGGKLWTAPYDEAVAVAALERADALSKAIAAVGIDTLAPGLPVAQGCWDCPRYDPTMPAPTRGTRTPLPPTPDLTGAVL